MSLLIQKESAKHPQEEINSVKSTDNTTENQLSSSKLKSETKNEDKKKKLPAKYKCRTCNRYYLGARMKKHLSLNPSHKVPHTSEPNDEIWKNLLDRLNTLPRHKRINKFFGEMSYILQKMRNVISTSLKSTVKENESSAYQIDDMLSLVLGIPEGKYILDPDIFQEDSISNSNSRDNNSRNTFDSEHSAQTSLLNLLDTGQVSFDTTDSANSSEAVMCVDQLVNERLKTLTGVELSGPSTANTSQNLTLDLSLDMFSYAS